MTSQKFLLHFSVLDTMYWWSMMKNIHSPNLVGIGSRRPEIWSHKYLISPIEISINYLVPNYEPGQFTLISMGLIRYSCGHFLDHHEPLHVKFGVWGFFILFYWKMVMKMLKCQKRKFDDITLQYSITYGEAGSVAVLPRRYAPMGPGSIPSPGAVCAFGFQSILASSGLLRVLRFSVLHIKLDLSVSKHHIEASLEFNAFALLGFAWFSAESYK